MRPDTYPLVPTLLLLLVGSCGSAADTRATNPPLAPVQQTATPAPSSAEPSSAAGQPIPIVAFQLADSQSGAVKVEVKADGSIVTATGEPWGQLDGRAITLADTSEPLWQVDDHGDCRSSLFDKVSFHFRSDDALLVEAPRGTSIATIDAAGNVVFDDTKGNTESPWRVVDMTAAARRAALLLSLSIMR